MSVNRLLLIRPSDLIGITSIDNLIIDSDFLAECPGVEISKVFTSLIDKNIKSLTIYACHSHGRNIAAMFFAKNLDKLEEFIMYRKEFNLVFPNIFISIANRVKKFWLSSYGNFVIYNKEYDTFVQNILKNKLTDLKLPHSVIDINGICEIIEKHESLKIFNIYEVFLCIKEMNHIVVSARKSKSVEKMILPKLVNCEDSLQRSAIEKNLQFASRNRLVPIYVMIIWSRKTKIISRLPRCVVRMILKMIYY